MATKAKRRSKAKPVKDARIMPTGERLQHGAVVSAGMAHRFVPVIDTLRDGGRITDREHAALAFYRNQADLAERSPVKSCLDFGVSGGGGDIHLSASVVSALLVVSRIDRDLGSLCDLVKAIAVNDWSLTRWCCERFGARERRDGSGAFVAMVPLGEKRAVATALLELRNAAGLIIA